MSETPRTDTDVSAGLLANYLAMAVVGASGLAINLLIAAAVGADGLGLFSQTYVVFVIAAQPATGGLHHATLRFAALFDDDGGRQVLRAALVAVVPVSIVVAAVTAALADPIASIADSPRLASAIPPAAAGLVFHALAKVLLAHANARREMSTFAAFQALRVTLLAGAVGAILLLSDDPADLGYALLISEALLSLALLANRGLRFPPVGDAEVPGSRALLSFGSRSFGGAILQELNARVDVVVLAVLVSDTEVGVYTLAATLIEGAFQLIVVLRNNLNPVLAQALAAGDRSAVEQLAARYRTTIVAVAAAAWLAVALIFRPATDLLGLDTDFADAWAPLLILTTGLGLAAVLLPFDQIFLLGGRPATQTLVMTGVVVANLALNVVLVPWLGIEGAAISTAGAFVALAITIWVFARKRFGIRLL